MTGVRIAALVLGPAPAVIVGGQGDRVPRGVISPMVAERPAAEA
jgi:hypothetical protein